MFIYFHRNYQYRKHNNTVGYSKFSATKHSPPHVVIITGYAFSSVMKKYWYKRLKNALVYLFDGIPTLN